MPGYGLERKGVGVHNGIPTRIHEEGGQVNSSRSRLLTGMGKKLPTTKASLFVLVAFAIWYSEDYLLFANPRITMLSFNSVVAESVPPNVIAMSITLGGFLLLFLLYKQRLFAICEGYGLVASSAMTALGAILLNVSWTLESPPWLSVVGFSMITFGHQCFLPEMVKHLACLGTSRALTCYGATLVLLVVLKFAFRMMPDGGLLVFLAVATLVMLACVRAADRSHEHTVVLRKDSKERVPRTLMIMQVVVGLLVGMHLFLANSIQADMIVPETIGRCRVEKVPVEKLGEWLRLGGAR